MSQQPQKKKLFTVSNIITAILLIFIGAMLFSADFKGKVMGGLMKVGLFQPSVPTDLPEETSNLSALNFRVSDSEGNFIELADLDNKVIFINFWATWCPPCKAEMPTINELYNNHKNNPDAVFLMVDVDNKPEKSLQYISDMQFDLPVHFPASSIPQELFKGSLPTTIVIDKAGRIIFNHEGMADFSNAQFGDFFEKLLE